MGDLTLADGREINIDLNAFTIKEWRELWTPEQSAEKEAVVLAKASGLTPDEVENLPYLDFRHLAKALLNKARDALADPT